MAKKKKTIAVNGVEKETTRAKLSYATAAQLALGEGYDSKARYTVIVYNPCFGSGDSLNPGAEAAIEDGAIVTVEPRS